MLKMDLEYKKNILFVRLNGVLNRNSSYKLNFYVTPVLKKHSIKYLVYNLANLNDIDSLGIDAIINTKWQIRENKGKIALCKVKPIVKSKLNKLRLPSITCERKAFSLVEA